MPENLNLIAVDLIGISTLFQQAITTKESMDDRGVKLVPGLALGRTRGPVKTSEDRTIFAFYCLESTLKI